MNKEEAEAISNEIKFLKGLSVESWPKWSDDLAADMTRLALDRLEEAIPGGEDKIPLRLSILATVIGYLLGRYLASVAEDTREVSQMFLCQMATKVAARIDALTEDDFEKRVKE